MISLAVLWPGCSCLSWEGGTCHVCVWPQAPLVLQPTADLGGRQQTLSGMDLMICAVTTSSLLGHPGAWQSSASSLKLDELINEPGKSGIAASSITPVFFSRELCPIPAAGAQAVVSLPLCSIVAVSPHKSGEKGSGWHWHWGWEGLGMHCHVPRAWEPGVLGLLKAEDSQLGQGDCKPLAEGELLRECWKR